MRQVKGDILARDSLHPSGTYLLYDTAEPFVRIPSSGALRLGYLGSNLSSATPRLGDLRQTTVSLHTSVSSSVKTGWLYFTLVVIVARVKRVHAQKVLRKK